MYWMLKKGLEHDLKFRELCDNLKKLEINHGFYDVVPFSNGLDLDWDVTEINKKEPIFCYGSYTLSKIVKQNNVTPGAYLSPNLSLDVLLSHYGEEMFNNDMVFGTIEHIQMEEEQMFFRPMEDTKAFNSGLVNKIEFERIRANIMNLRELDYYSTVVPETMVVLSKPKPIDQEIRFFIVDHKISTYSQYKLGTQVLYSETVDPYLVEYVEKIIGIWEPELAYCLDIAVYDGVPKILEINSINSAGLYAMDTQKFVMSIEDLTKYYI